MARSTVPQTVYAYEDLDRELAVEIVTVDNEAVVMAEDDVVADAVSEEATVAEEVATEEVATEETAVEEAIETIAIDETIATEEVVTEIVEENVTEAEFVEETISADAATAYVDMSAVGGTRYYYTVKAYNATQTSTYISANVVALLPTPATKIILVTTGVKVSWNLIDGAEGYYVYRKVVGGSYEQIADITGKNYFLDKTAVKGKQYYYTVKAYANGKVSGYSSVLVSVPK